MIRRDWIGIVVVAGLVFLGVAPVANQTPVFRTSVESVVVNVAVTRRGAPVTGLTASDFVLLDNGRPQTVGTLLEATPIDVTFLTESINRLIDRDLARVKGIAALASRVGALLRPDDRLRVLEGSDQVREARPMKDMRGPLGQGQLSLANGSSLMDAVFHALAWPVTPGRRHMIAVFSDGMDGRSSTLEPELLPLVAAKSDAVLHAVLFATPATDRIPALRGQMDDWEKSHAAVVTAVERTGGDVHHGARSDERLERALEHFRSSYALHYTPRDVARDGWHEIKVTLPNHPGVEIHARKGYGGD